MKVKTLRFGEIEIEESELLYFRYGILGFEHCHRYALIRGSAESPFSYLQSVEEPDLTFIVTSPMWFRPDYQVKLGPGTLEELGAAAMDDLAVYVIVTVPKDPVEMTVNLLAPLLICRTTHNAMQLVQIDVPYQTRHKLAEELERLEQKTSSQEGTQSGDGAGEVPLRTVG